MRAPEAAYSSNFSLASMRCGRLQMGQSTGTIIVSGPIKSSLITLCTCLSVMGQHKVMARLLSRIVAFANSFETQMCNLSAQSGLFKKDQSDSSKGAGCGAFQR
jgi:hypothetical protein